MVILAKTVLILNDWTRNGMAWLGLAMAWLEFPAWLDAILFHFFSSQMMQFYV